MPHIFIFAMLYFYFWVGQPVLDAAMNSAFVTAAVVAGLFAIACIGDMFTK